MFLMSEGWDQVGDPYLDGAWGSPWWEAEASRGNFSSCAQRLSGGAVAAAKSGRVYEGRLGGRPEQSWDSCVRRPGPWSLVGPGVPSLE